MSKYRQNVAAFIVDGSGLILICRRSDKFKTWQLPQGGIDEEESPSEALHRELLEEIGTDKIEIIHQLKDTIRYNWPEHLHRDGFIGQEQTFFLVRLRGKIDLEHASSKEFDKFNWINSSQFKQIDSGFKTQAYRLALEKLTKLFPELFMEN